MQVISSRLRREVLAKISQMKRRSIAGMLFFAGHVGRRTTGTLTLLTWGCRWRCTMLFPVIESHSEKRDRDTRHDNLMAMQPRRRPLLLSPPLGGQVSEHRAEPQAKDKQDSSLLFGTRGRPSQCHGRESKKQRRLHPTIYHRPRQSIRAPHTKLWRSGDKSSWTWWTMLESHATT